MKHFGFIFVAFFLFGCSGYKPEPYVMRDGSGGTVVSSTAAVASTYVRGESSSKIVCSAPPPDASFSESDSSNLDISLVKNEENTTADSDKLDDASNEVELTGRTPSVLLAREVFFRTCEISQNFKLSKEQALDLFKLSLQAVSDNWAGETANTTITISDTETTDSAIETSDSSSLPDNDE